MVVSVPIQNDDDLFFFVFAKLPLGVVFVPRTINAYISIPVLVLSSGHVDIGADVRRRRRPQ